jgi:putative hemolysin
MTLSIPLIVALVVVAWLTAGGMAVRSVSRIWLRHWAERRLRGSGAATLYLERPNRLVAAAGAGVAITLLVSGVLIGVAADSATGLATITAALVYAGLVVLLSQLVPRAVARRWPAQIIPVVLPVVRAADYLSSPLLSAGRAIARPLAPPSTRAEGDAEPERDAIQDLLRQGELEGIGDHQEITIISGVVEFSEKRVADVMRPRAEIFALDAALDAASLAERTAQSGYSRVPIYRGTLDSVIGMIHAFDVIKAPHHPLGALRPVAFAVSTTPCNELLFRMLRERMHLAIVRDDAGRTLGLVTLEDLLEELVGDIRDEHDEPTGG